MPGCRMGRWPPTWKSEIRKLSEVRGRRFRLALPADRDSWVAGTRPAAQSATGPHSGENAGGADERRNCDERIVFLSMTCCAIRGGIKNTTDKVRRPGAVRRRRDAVCTERVVGKPEVCRVISVDAKSADSLIDLCRTVHRPPGSYPETGVMSGWATIRSSKISSLMVATVPTRPSQWSLRLHRATVALLLRWQRAVRRQMTETGIVCLKGP